MNARLKKNGERFSWQIVCPEKMLSAAKAEEAFIFKPVQISSSVRSCVHDDHRLDKSTLNRAREVVKVRKGITLGFYITWRNYTLKFCG